MSPGTTSVASISRRAPARTTVVWGKSIARIASSAASALPSWMPGSKVCQSMKLRKREAYDAAVDQT